MPYDPDTLLAGARVLSGPLSFSDLPAELQSDKDLADNVRGFYGADPSQFTYRLVELDLQALRRSLPPDDTEFYAHLARRGARVYRDIERRWRREYASQLAAAGPDADAWEIDPQFPDGERRADLVEQYAAALAAGGEVTPLVIDLHSLTDDPRYSGAHIMDGKHRFAAHIISGASPVRFFQLLPD